MDDKNRITFKELQKYTELLTTGDDSYTKRLSVFMENETDASEFLDIFAEESVSHDFKPWIRQDMNESMKSECQAAFQYHYAVILFIAKCLFDARAEQEFNQSFIELGI